MRIFPGLVLALAVGAPAVADSTVAPPAARLRSNVFPWNDLIAHPTKTGARREVFNAPTTTLNLFHCHISTLNPGENTGAPHRHPQEELVILKEGVLEVNINGTTQAVSAGSMIFYSANELENMRNIGTAPATYYVVQFFTPLTPKP